MVNEPMTRGFFAGLVWMLLLLRDFGFDGLSGASGDVSFARGRKARRNVGSFDREELIFKFDVMSDVIKG